jgi:hypothetical protein
MTSNASSKENPQRLAERNLLKAEPAAAQEIAGFLAASARLLADARRQDLADETRFIASDLDRVVRGWLATHRPDLEKE